MNKDKIDAIELLEKMNIELNNTLNMTEEDFLDWLKKTGFNKTDKVSECCKSPLWDLDTLSDTIDNGGFYIGYESLCEECLENYGFTDTSLTD